MKLHMETGHPVTADVKCIDGDSIRFVTEDHRTMLEVKIIKSGRGIEVRGVEVTKDGSELLSGNIDVRPRANNCVEIRMRPYKED